MYSETEVNILKNCLGSIQKGLAAIKEVSSDEVVLRLADTTINYIQKTLEIAKICEEVHKEV